MMESILRTGMLAIQYLQLNFKSYSKWMIWISNFSNPGWSYVVYFPLTFYLNKSVGRRVLWMAAISEWLNSILKWILYGDRPYWWAHEAGMCYGISQPCNQFPITCETGPGSPSGHCMVTLSVFYIMVSAMNYHIFNRTHYRTVASWILWTLFAVIACAINISRCFILAHFPHQVLVGSLVAVVIAIYFNLLSTTSMGLRHYLCAAIGMFVSALAVYFTLIQLGLDPLWSLSKAQQWCARSSWIHLQTSLFASVVKASSSILGLGLSEVFSSSGFMNNTLVLDVSSQPIFKLTCFLSAIFFSFSIELVQLPQENALLFYFLTYVKFIVVIFVITSVIPLFVGKLGSCLTKKLKSK